MLSLADRSADKWRVRTRALVIALIAAAVMASPVAAVTITPKAGLYEGFTHKRRTFSLRVDGRTVSEVSVAGTRITTARLELDAQDQFLWRQGVQEIWGFVDSPEHIRGTITLSKGDLEHFDVYWKRP